MYAVWGETVKGPLPAHLDPRILELIFTFLELGDLRSCALVCRPWCRVLSDGDSEVWRLLCGRSLSSEAMAGELLASVKTHKARLRAFHNAWNPNDCSRNVYVKPNGFTLHRNPVAQSTDACRGKLGYRRGRHAWEIMWEGPLGTVAVVGVATKDATLQCPGYVALLGSNRHSWGWNLVENVLLHDGETRGNYPRRGDVKNYQVGETVRVVLDCENRTLSFERGFEFLGVAFRGLPNKKFYPSVSAVYGNTEVSMVYVGPPLDG